MNTEQAASRLAAYTKALAEFQFAKEIDGNYQHMGATITDAILQAGIGYDAVVRRRVAALRANYPEAKSTSGFLELLDTVGATQILDWHGPTKIDRIMSLTRLLKSEGIEDENELQAWLGLPSNVIKLRALKGIKEKTSDYLAKLAGAETSAPDRLLLEFLNEAGIDISISEYGLAKQIIDRAADILAIPRSIYDQSIWNYKSGRDKSCG